jgi:hypothetical protein
MAKGVFGNGQDGDGGFDCSSKMEEEEEQVLVRGL